MPWKLTTVVDLRRYRHWKINTYRSINNRKWNNYIVRCNDRFKFKKILSSRYDYSRVNNLGSNISDTLIRNHPFIKGKKYTSVNSFVNRYVYVIDDLNVNFSSSSSRNSVALTRQLLETRRLYSDEDNSVLNFDHVDFVLVATSTGY